MCLEAGCATLHLEMKSGHVVKAQPTALATMPADVEASATMDAGLRRGLNSDLNSDREKQYAVLAFAHYKEEIGRAHV